MTLAQIPSVQLDNVRAEATTGLVVFNRIPEPEETGVPVDSTIYLTLTSETINPLDSSDVSSVRINGDLAVLNGAFRPGFQGPESSITTPIGNILLIAVDPETDLPPDTEISVRIVYDVSIERIYSFRTQDTVAPTVSSVTAVGKQTVRVTFNESMLQTTVTGGSALNPENYTIARNPPENIPAVDVSGASVSTVNTTTVDLNTDIELSFGLPYRLTTENVEDVHGNVIVTTTDDFTAFSPDVPEGRRFQIWELLPLFNRDEDDTNDLLRFTGVLQDVVDLLLCEIDLFADTLDPDTAPEDFLDAMLQDLGNPFTFDLTELEKRRLIQLLVPIYRQKGTAVGIINVIRLFLGIEVTIRAYNVGSAWRLGADGTQPRIRTVSSEPFALADGETLLVRVDDETTQTVTFNTADFVDIANATAEEVGDAISADLTGAVAADCSDDTVLMQRNRQGTGASIQVVGGTATALDFPTDITRGTGTEAPDAGRLGVTTILGPGTSFQIYSFEVISPIVLTIEQRDRITEIVEYMKPAHTHLNAIVEP